MYTKNRVYFGAMFLVTFFICVSSSLSMAATVYVFPGGADTNDGSSWLTAKRTVQAGLNAAVASDQVWVAVGTYIENITLKNGVALYGGLAGTEDPATFGLANRDFAANETILDGNQAGSVVTASSCTATTTRIDGFTIRNGRKSNGNGGGIYCYSSSPTISNNAITGNSASRLGGGIYCYYSSPTITNNTIAGNSASSGGGIDCSSYSSPRITNNTIAGNSASSGGGIDCDYSSPTVTNNIIAFNSSGIGNCLGTPTLRYNCIYGNSIPNYTDITNPTDSNGNISVDPLLGDLWHGNVHIQPGSPCVDAGDDAVVDSAWMDIDGQARIQGTHVDIGADESDGTVWQQESANPVFYVSPTGNNSNDGLSWATAKQTVQGGIDAASRVGSEVWVQSGTYNERITLRLFSFVYGGFSGTETAREERDWRTNETILDGRHGGSVVTARAVVMGQLDGFTIRNGAASSGGGIDCYYSSLTITNNTIMGNCTSTRYGGGICCSYSLLTITNNTIAGNNAYFGGGIYCAGSSPTITNNTITGNGASSSGGGIYCSSSPMITNNIVAFNSSGIYKSSGTPTLRHNCVFGNTAYNYSGIADPTGSNGNISADPLLGDLRHGNVHIQPKSACVDAGDDTVIDTAWTDIDSQARIQGAHVDIGADESDGTTWQESTTVFYISPTGNDANDGLSWATAKLTVQAGIDAAAVLGGDVWVEAGTYNEQITLPWYVYLYGGFAGTESARQERDWQAHQTILDGQAGGSVVTIRGGYKINTIDGFTIRNGTETTSGDGGGIYCLYSSPVISNNTITGNSGSGICCSCSSPMLSNNIITGNRASSSGGGIYCYYYSSPTFINNTITGNSASSGGGIYCHYSSPTITNNAITGNNASSGGGIYCVDSSPTIANNTITGNNASYGGGICCEFVSSPTLTNNIITGNSASSSGGGICCEIVSSPTLTNNIITGNSASSGGGIYCHYSSPTITNNTITGNSASNSGGGICCEFSSSAVIANTIIAFNSSGIYKDSGAPMLNYNCIYGNTAYNYSGITDPMGSGGNICADPLFRSANPGADATWGTADDVLDNLRLAAGSPCIDAGDNAAILPAGVTTDLAGGLRFRDDSATTDIGSGIAPIVDMGAYEYLPKLAADFDDDNDVDGDDLLILEACTTDPAVPYAPQSLPTGCTLTPDGNGIIAADLDRDQDVDQIDFGILQRCYSGAGQSADPACVN